PEAVPKRASLASPSIGCRAPLVWLQRISLRNAKADAKREMRIEEKRGEYVRGVRGICSRSEGIYSGLVGLGAVDWRAA
ncbi:MAG TPA: hypothetical protein DCE42_01940, partial [Myxococcales bacterium]|nr:hypothetical protein [Myxococcales bacterium]